MRKSNSPPEILKTLVEKKLTQKLEQIKNEIGVGQEVAVKWFPRTIKYKDGKQLEEEVIGNTILIYTNKEERAEQLLTHGFAEWLLNQHVRKYRLFINKLIELFEQIQYEEKEKIADAIAKLIEKTKITQKQLNN